MISWILFFSAAVFASEVVPVPAATLVPSLKLDPAFAKNIGECKVPGKRRVWLFKQWSYDSRNSTRNIYPDNSIPQQKNLASAFRQIDSWLKASLVKEIFTDGCSGEITSQFSSSMNGWTMPELSSATSQELYPETITNSAVKLKAKYDKLKAYCADDEALILETNQAFSDARSTFNLLNRLELYKSIPDRAKELISESARTYHFSGDVQYYEATTRLVEAMRASVKRIKDSIEKRNVLIFEKIKASTEPVEIVLVSGLFTSGLRKQMDESGLGCTIVEPDGYQNAEVDELAKFEKVAAPALEPVPNP